MATGRSRIPQSGGRPRSDDPAGPARDSGRKGSSEDTQNADEDPKDAAFEWDQPEPDGDPEARSRSYAAGDQGRGAALAVYVLFLASVLIGLTSVIGLVLAYMSLGQAAGWLQSHFRYQIRTFWIGLLYGFAAILLMMTPLGPVLLMAVIAWYLVRAVKGLLHLTRNEPIPDPATWLI